ncbi:hypothetical protein LZ31DRAFT_38335 [Colletotrichum somersetense]|nr:hypothetical protein LZ31DRAFT_38335 [Colletotrichum somersetense]
MTWWGGEKIHYIPIGFPISVIANPQLCGLIILYSHGKAVAQTDCDCRPSPSGSRSRVASSSPGLAWTQPYWEDQATACSFGQIYRILGTAGLGNPLDDRRRQPPTDTIGPRPTLYICRLLPSGGKIRAANGQVVCILASPSCT